MNHWLWRSISTETLLREHGGGALNGDFDGFFDTHIWVPFFDPDDVSNLSCGTEEETSLRVLCECEDLASLRHAYLGSFFFWTLRCYESKYGGHLELW